MIAVSVYPSMDIRLFRNILFYMLEFMGKFSFWGLKLGFPQVTRSVDTEVGQLSYQEQKTVDAIVKAR